MSRKVSLAEKIKALEERYKTVNEHKENTKILEEKISDVAQHTEMIESLVKVVDVPAKDVSCSVCMESEPIVVFGCGHKKTCAKCSLQILIGTKVCPHCRKPIKSAVRVFE